MVLEGCEPQTSSMQNNTEQIEQPGCLDLTILIARLAVVYITLFLGAWIVLSVTVILVLELFGLHPNICFLVGVLAAFVVVKVAVFLGAHRLIPKSVTHGKKWRDA